MSVSQYRWWTATKTVPRPPSFALQEASCQGPVCDMIAMGFPTPIVSEVPAFIHGDCKKTLMKQTAYNCSHVMSYTSWTMYLVLV